MTEKELARQIADAFQYNDIEMLSEIVEHESKSARTFEDVMMLTHDAGLVIEMKDGSEFQLTIVQSRPARA